MHHPAASRTKLARRYDTHFPNNAVFLFSQIKEAALELGYQPDDTFCLKISQLREIFVVRWSVFLLGPAGCGKTAIWRTLLRAQILFGEKSTYKPINPKVRIFPCFSLDVGKFLKRFGAFVNAMQQQCS